MNIGFLFPGQGSQSLGMGKDLYDEYEAYRNVYERVKEITGIDVAKITFEGTPEELNKTNNTQICILTMSLAILEILKKYNIVANISAGLSLGEYTSLIYSNALSFEEGVNLVKQRGTYMHELVPNGEWLMAAVLGLSDNEVIKVCKDVKKGFVVPVNFNCEGQVVISGDKTGVEEAEIIAKEYGAKKVRVLKTSGPFHTEKLINASNELAKVLKEITINKFETKVVKNIDGTVYSENDNIKEILEKHIVSPVQFSKSLNTMVENGVDTFIEIGPGKTLSGFVKRLKDAENLQIYNINNIESLKNTIENLKKESVN